MKEGTLCFLASLLSLLPIVATAVDTITAEQPLADGQTIVSAGEEFELGFFSPVNSNKRYVGVWYKKVPATVVWVANRDTPLTNPSGVLTIGHDGNIVIVDQTTVVIKLSNQSKTDTVAQLLDSGNLVLRGQNEVESENPNYLWESFDYPGDTLLPGMKLGWDSKTGLNRQLTSWKSADDPSSGDYVFKMDTIGWPEFFLMDKKERKYRTGPWNGIGLSGVPEMKSSRTGPIAFQFTMNRDEIHYSFKVRNRSLLSKFRLSPSGTLQRDTWIEERKFWNRFWYAPKDQCDGYAECGVNGVCDTSASPVCKCPQGFQPRNPTAWELRDGSDGCVRRSKLNCGDDDGFVALKSTKLPEASRLFVDDSMSLADCGRMCRSNCYCTAYANSNISGGGHGCVIWTDDLLDMRQYAAGEAGQTLYVKVAASDLDDEKRDKTRFIAITTMVGLFTLAFFTYFSLRMVVRKRVIKRRMRRISKMLHFNRWKGYPKGPNEALLEGFTKHVKLDELPLFKIETLAVATDNFSSCNQLGQGGFGVVYKGQLQNGGKIAVKRLSETSGQGLQEFMNEVMVISKLQHRNLVRLLGCCVEREETMLIYEFMPNKSLDAFLFDTVKKKHLDWKTRFNIIEGIGRGLLYLHRDSRLKIIHRDLKASNILLDEELNPKISDFGIAKIFGDNQDHDKTRRVIGTYGYMAPEYITKGRYSEKSDVFSFGVLLLEIISGRRSTNFHDNKLALNLFELVWKLWEEDNLISLTDPVIANPSFQREVLQCIHVGLLCVQEFSIDRPSISSVLSMLTSETEYLPTPKQPAFIGRQFSTAAVSTINNVTITAIGGR